ncbi:hypothetical protein TYRP_006948 [Tyrophagus putrescentiae]|nr:hypothetical protein TYRP_006948 [Tyrophagus putrescentiae]
MIASLLIWNRRGLQCTSSARGYLLGTCHFCTCAFQVQATKMTTTTTTKALTCDLLALSSVVDNNNNNSSKIDSRRIRAKRRRRGGENGDLNANGLIGLLALCCCLCFCCLISASSGFVIPALPPKSSASSSHLFEVDVSRHGPLPAIQRLNHSETVPNNNSSNKSSPVGSLSADSSTRQRPKRHILPAQQQQPNHHHHHQSSSSSSASTSESSLPINVRNGGGEVFRQVISANTDADYIRLEFTDTDGSLVRTLVDFRNVSAKLFFLFFFELGLRM